MNHTLETSADEQAFGDAITCLSMGGTCALVTVPHLGEPFSFAPRTLIALEATLKGVLEGSSIPDVFIPRLIDLYAKGKFPIDRLITTYPFSDINQAVADSHSGTTIKPVVLMADA